MLIPALLTTVLATSLCQEGAVRVVADPALRPEVDGALRLSLAEQGAFGLCTSEARAGFGPEILVRPGESPNVVIVEGFLDGAAAFHQSLDLVDTPVGARALVLVAALEEAAAALAAGGPSPRGRESSEAISDERVKTTPDRAWNAFFVATVAGATGASIYLVPSLGLVFVTSSQIYLNAVMNFGTLGQWVRPAQDAFSMAAGLGLVGTPVVGGAAAVVAAAAAALVFDDGWVATGAGMGTALGVGLGLGVGASVAALGCLYLLEFGSRTRLPAPPPALVFGAELAPGYLVLMSMSWLIYTAPAWAFVGAGAGGALGALGGRGVRALLTGHEEIARAE